MRWFAQGWKMVCTRTAQGNKREMVCTRMAQGKRDGLHSFCWLPCGSLAAAVHASQMAAMQCLLCGSHAAGMQCLICIPHSWADFPWLSSPVRGFLVCASHWDGF